MYSTHVYIEIHKNLLRFCCFEDFLVFGPLLKHFFLTPITMHQQLAAHSQQLKARAVAHACRVSMFLGGSASVSVTHYTA